MHNEGMLPANAQRPDEYDTAEHIRKQALNPHRTIITLFMAAAKLFKRASPCCLDHHCIPLVP